MDSMKNPKFFMSHDHRDKEILSELKAIFLEHGIHLFLAHEDISGGEDYIEKIKTELCESDIVILYANNNSKNSHFCNQEIGWSLSLNKPFITIGNGDWGLMPKQQCYKLKPGKEFECFSSIMRDERVIKAVSKFEQYKKKSNALKVLAKMNYSGFRVHSKVPSRSEEEKLSNKWIHLIPNSHNNFWFYTGFIIKYIINHQKEERYYKIGYSGQIGGNSRKCSFTNKKMNKHFLWLPDNFLSRRIEIEDGVLLNDIKYTNVDKAISILLRDYEYDKNLKKGFENEGFFQKSLSLNEF